MDEALRTALEQLRRAYHAIPAGTPPDAEVIAKLPDLYAAIEALMASGDGGLDPGNGNQDAASAPSSHHPSPDAALSSTGSADSDTAPLDVERLAQIAVMTLGEITTMPEYERLHVEFPRRFKDRLARAAEHRPF